MRLFTTPLPLRTLLGALIALLCLLTWSGWHPYDRITWVMEVAPILIALPLLVISYGRYPLTPLLYVLLFAHAVVLLVGGAYTYARVPLGFDVAQFFELSRNPYDKLGHFMQGLVPAVVAREILLRGDYVKGRKMLAFVVISIVLAISASYELIEWAAALSLGQGADEFLGTQGDPWDTQSDMFFALVGGVTALWTLSASHDRQLAKLPGHIT
jgi:putative membrane protein